MALSVYMATVSEAPCVPTRGLYAGVPWTAADGAHAWRVGDLSRRACLRPAFGRRKDAELALRALHENGLATREAIIEAGWQRVEQVMLAALQW